MTTSFGVLEELPQAIAARDFGRLERCLHPDARMRALTPGRLHEATTAPAVVALFETFFKKPNELLLVESSVVSIQGRPRLSYRLRGEEGGRAFTVEQTAYCSLVDDAVGVIDLVCSGYRFDDTPRADRSQLHDFNAGDLGCASGLTTEVRRRLGEIAVGDRLRVSTLDPGAREDLPAFARMLGQRVLEVERTDEGAIITLERTR